MDSRDPFEVTPATIDADQAVLVRMSELVEVLESKEMATGRRSGVRSVGVAEAEVDAHNSAAHNLIGMPFQAEEVHV